MHALMLALVLTAPAAAGGDPAAGQWPQFRGPRSAGVAEGEGLPDSWSRTENVRFAVEVPGRGWSSPIVWGKRIFLTSAVNEGKDEEPRKGLYFGGERPAPPASPHRWIVLALDLETGKTLWERTAHRGAPQGARHLKNSFASETPLADGERVYAYFGNLGLFAYDLDGRELWSARWGSFKTRYGWGTAASPALHAGRVFVVHDNEERSFLVALDARSGKELWRRDRDEKSNWATPFVWENSRRTELVTPGTGRVRSYDLEGKLLWELGGMSSITIPTPFERSGLLYVGSGYVMDKQKPLYAIRPGGSGDISLKEGESSSEHIGWCERDAAPYNPSPLAYGDHLYVLFDRGFLACRDARSGKEVYGRRRLDPAAAAFTASPWAYDGKVFCLSEDGDAFVVQAGPEYKLLRKNSLDEMCMATPAIAGGSLLIRTMTRLYRIGGK